MMATKVGKKIEAYLFNEIQVIYHYSQLTLCC